MTDTIANMTRPELEHLIRDLAHEMILQERLAEYDDNSWLDDENDFDDGEPDNRTWEEVQESIDRNMWTPPPGAKSSLELLREDRER